MKAVVKKSLFSALCAFGALATNGEFTMRSIAHRGLHGEGIAQNSVESFKAAWSNGVKQIETDFHLLDSGRILCVHDRGELKRISGVDRVVAELTERDVAAIDIGRLAKTAKPVRMPFLEDVLATVPASCIAQCEIKRYGRGYADKFDAARKAAGLGETNILVTSFQIGALADFKRRYPKYQTGWLLGAAIKDSFKCEKIILQAQKAKVDIICPGALNAMKVKLTREDADKIRAAGFDFRLYGVNSPEQLKYAYLLKATAFTCDHWKDSFEWAKAIDGLKLVP